MADGGVRTLARSRSPRGRRRATPARRGAVRVGRLRRCHVIDGRGGILGPELTAIGALRGPTHLRDSIVKPAASHPPGYLVVEPRQSGAEIRGIRVNEDVFWIHIRDSGGTVHALEKSSLARLDRELEAR